MDTDKIIFGVIGLVTVGILVIILATSFKRPVEVNSQNIEGDNPHIKGAENPKLTIVEFSDFECPYCKKNVSILNALLGKYPNDLAVAYRHFPLPSHSGSRPAARASEAAAKQGKFWEYHDELFANQPNFTVSDLEKYAGDIELDVDRFKNDYNSPETAQNVQEDADLSSTLKLGGTPTFFLIYDGKVEKSTGDIQKDVERILGK